MDWIFILKQTLTAAFSLQAVAYVLAAMGLNIHFGYTGLLNFGQAGFVAIGAYGVGITYETFGWGMWWGILVGIAWAVIFALLLGIPTLRLRGDYLAIVTIAAAEIVRLVVRSEATSSVTGGNSGINGFADAFYDLNPLQNGRRYTFGPLAYSGAELWIMFWGWLLVALFALLTYLLMRSPWGRVLRSIREDENAARALGKNVYSYKMQALVLGGVIGAVGGMVWAIGEQSIIPDSYATRTTFIAYAALILGGAARVAGPIVGGILFYMVFRFTDLVANEAAKAKVIPESIMNTTQAGVVSLMFLGLALILLMVFRPQGVFGNKREVELDAR